MASTVLQLGKHYGPTFGEVCRWHPDYIDWASAQLDPSPQLQALVDDAEAKWHKSTPLRKRKSCDREPSFSPERVRRIAELRSARSAREKGEDNNEVEARVVLGSGGSRTIRGAPEHVATVLPALDSKDRPN